MPHKVLKLVMAHLESLNNKVVVAAWSLIAQWCLMAAQWDAQKSDPQNWTLVEVHD